MWNEESIKDYLKEHLKESRYKHVLGVAETAEKLAEINGADKEKARYAGLIHDLAKYESDERLLELAHEGGHEACIAEKVCPQLLHGFGAAMIAERVMGIKDREILDAAIYHTTGRENMTLLDKIIYVADYIEPNRDFPGVETIRSVTFDDLDKGVMMAFDNTIRYVIANKGILHLMTIEARNCLLLEMTRGKKDE